MHSEQTLLNLISRTYDAALDSKLWPCFLTEFTRAIDAVGTGLYVQDLQSHEASINAAANLDPVYLREYEEHYCHVNVFLMHGKGQMGEGRVFTGSGMCPQNVVVGSEYYNDCLHHYDLLYPMGAVILQTRSLASLLTSWRSKIRGDFDEDDSALLAALLPHLRRAVQIHRRIDQVTFERDSAADMLDRLAVGTILTNADGEVILVNRAAAMILEARDGLTIERHQLRAERHNETVALGALIAQAAQTSNGEGTAAGGTLTLSRPSGLRPLEFLVTPFPTRDRGQVSSSQPASVAVFVTDPEHRPLVPAEMLRALYHLTRAEAALASRLALGDTLGEAADALAITANTARWHIKHIFQKTQTASQSQLMRRMLTGPAMLMEKEGP